MDVLSGTGHVSSPCQSICRLDRESRICTACWRSMEEIASWIRLTNDDKRAAIMAAEQRRQDASPDFRARMDQQRDEEMAKRQGHLVRPKTSR